MKNITITITRAVEAETNRKVEFCNNQQFFGTSHYMRVFEHDRHTGYMRPTCHGVSHQEAIYDALASGELLPGSWIPEKECPICTAALTVLRAHQELTDKRIDICEICGHESNCYVP